MFKEKKKKKKKGVSAFTFTNMTLTTLVILSLTTDFSFRFHLQILTYTVFNQTLQLIPFKTLGILQTGELENIHHYENTFS